MSQCSSSSSPGPETSNSLEKTIYELIQPDFLKGHSDFKKTSAKAFLQNHKIILIFFWLKISPFSKFRDEKLIHEIQSPCLAKRGCHPPKKVLWCAKKIDEFQVDVGSTFTTQTKHVLFLVAVGLFGGCSKVPQKACLCVCVFFFSEESLVQEVTIN